MKMSIEWHEDSLKNWQATLDRELEILERSKARYEKSLREYHISLRKLVEARRRKLDGYDPERFMKKAGKP